MMEYFATTRSELATTIRQALGAFGETYDAVSGDLGADAASRLADFASRGKMLRGSLVRLGYELVSQHDATEPDATAIRLAGAAMELFQSGLLVHDDIMDRDRVRRGFPTMHVGYQSTLESGGYDDPAHYGEALGICVGDLAYFAAFQLLTEMPAPAARAVQAAHIAARELCVVGIAQMQDVVNGAVLQDSANPFRDAPTDPSEEDILKLYRYKTGRYTFSLPLALGCALAGGSDAERLTLEQAGEDLGVLFQLKDDELGLFADEAVLGKPVGADIREDKKTIFRRRLMSRADGQTRARLTAIFGHHDAGSAEADVVRSELQRLGIRAEIAAMMQARADAALGHMKPLLDEAPAGAALAFRELVTYSLERTS
ncbi:MAG TPA: polyprenyl synthetase family protein [bacterium]|nr:polyprenyl synthetase family protein [bacterium]